MTEDEDIHRIPDLSLKEHIQIAERHLQRALSLAYNDEPQPYGVKVRLARAHSILTTFLAKDQLR